MQVVEQVDRQQHAGDKPDLGRNGKNDHGHHCNKNHNPQDPIEHNSPFFGTKVVQRTKLAYYINYTPKITSCQVFK